MSSESEEEDDDDVEVYKDSELATELFGVKLIEGRSKGRRMKMTAATAAKRQIKLATTMKMRATTTMMPMTAITMSITRAGKAAPSPNAGGGIDTTESATTGAHPIKLGLVYRPNN